MTGKEIIIISALAAGAYLLLGGSGAFGGVEGGGGKKATAITGITPGQGQNPSTPTYPDPGQNPSTPTYPDQKPFQPSQYLMDLINQKYSAESMGLSPLSKKETQKLWSSNPGVSNVISDIKQQGATVYTAPKLYDSRMVEYYVEIGGETGLNPTTTTKKENSSGSFSVSSGGANKPSAGTTVYLSPGQSLSNFKPAASSSSSSSKKSSSSSSGEYRYGGSVGGWGV